MRFRPSFGKLLVLLVLVLSPVLSAQARVLRVDAEVVSADFGRLEQLHARIDWPAGAPQGRLQLRVERAQLPALAFDARRLDWQCPLLREGSEYRCAGALRLAGQPTRQLALRMDAASFDAEFKAGATRIALASQAGAPGHLQIQLEKLPVLWLQALASTLWAEGRWSDGHLAGQLQLASTAQATTLKGSLQLTNLALETPDGLIAAAGLSGKGSLELHLAAKSRRAALDAELLGGEVLAGGLYVPLPKTPVSLVLQGEQSGNDGWRLSKLGWRDREVLDVQGQAQLDRNATLRTLSLAVSIKDLAQARDRYLSGFLAPAGFSDLVLNGGLDARISMLDGQLDALAIRMHSIAAIDPRQRFVLAGVEGDLHWHHGSEPVRSEFGWASGALYGIGLGPARFALESSDGEVRTREPMVVAALQGRIVLEHLRWQPPRNEQGARFQLGVAMTELDLGSLSQRLGWPPFSGSLAGRIPSARYERGVLALDGGLTMQLFQGQITLSELVMERPFGIAPTLSADVKIDDIDLEPLTAAFGFGSINGRLDGRIDALRLVDWAPVAFAARLDTDTGWKGKRRISQRAVQDISSIAGSGLLAGLQAQALKLFDDFGYARIGLGCRLRENICAMDGVSSAGDGYTIVEGAGLPRIQVVGFRRRVDWPLLVARLKAVTEGQRPVFE